LGKGDRNRKRIVPTESNEAEGLLEVKAKNKIAPTRDGKKKKAAEAINHA